MSLHFLIDGYNVIKQIDSLRDIRTLKDARMSLMRIIQARRLMGSKNNQVEIVFDGKGDYNFYPDQSRGQIKIIFSKGESADETIKRIVSNTANPKQKMVVTNDKAIIFFIRSCGAKAMSVSEFFKGEQEQLDSKQKQIRREAESLKLELTYQQQEAINQELRKIWE